MKELVYTKDLIVEDLFIGGYSHKNLTISGRIYKEIKKSWFKKPRTNYTYTISTPLIEDPFYDGEYGTNRILKAYSVQMKQYLIDKIQEFKENDSTRTERQEGKIRRNNKFFY